MTKTRRRYKNYLKSPAWKNKRAQVIFRDAGQCRATRGGVPCGSRDGLEVHHLTYARFGKEPLGDLITLCHHCHKAIHQQQTDT